MFIVSTIYNDCECYETDGKNCYKRRSFDGEKINILNDNFSIFPSKHMENLIGFSSVMQLE